MTNAKKTTTKKAVVKTNGLEIVAHIPVQQYGFIEVKGDATQLEEIKETYSQLSEKPMAWPQRTTDGGAVDTSGSPSSLLDNSSRVVPFIFGKGSILFDDKSHVYHATDGKSVVSGSAFADRFQEEFLADHIAGKMAEKHGVDASKIIDMWNKNSEASTSLGTAIHAGLELYGKYLNLSMAIKGSSESALHSNSIIRNAVMLFFADKEKEVALYEPAVGYYHPSKDAWLVGFVDRVLSVNKEKKIVRVQDFKTNPDISKKIRLKPEVKGIIDATKLGVYWLQLSFYAYIIEKAGYTVEGLDIFNYVDDAWVTYSHDVVDVEGLL